MLGSVFTLVSAVIWFLLISNKNLVLELLNISLY